jgi:hypothetical protein
MIFRFDSQNLRAGVRVFLNGELVSGVVLADEEEGIVYKLKEFPLPCRASPLPRLDGSSTGRTTLCATFQKDERGQYVMERRRGKVRVELPPQSEIERLIAEIWRDLNTPEDTTESEGP